MMASRLSLAGVADRERAVRIWLKGLRAALAGDWLNGYSFSHSAPSLTSARVFCNRGFRFLVVGEAGRAGANVDVTLRVGDFDALFFEEAVNPVAQRTLDEEVAARLVRPGEQAEVERGVGEVHELHRRLRLFEEELNALGSAQQRLGDVVGVGGVG